MLTVVEGWDRAARNYMLGHKTNDRLIRIDYKGPGSHKIEPQESSKTAGRYNQEPFIGVTHRSFLGTRPMEL